MLRCRTFELAFRVGYTTMLVYAAGPDSTVRGGARVIEEAADFGCAGLDLRRRTSQTSLPLRWPVADGVRILADNGVVAGLAMLPFADLVLTVGLADVFILAAIGVDFAAGAVVRAARQESWRAGKRSCAEERLWTAAAQLTAPAHATPVFADVPLLVAAVAGVVTGAEGL